jgi:hypothetical protein
LPSLLREAVNPFVGPIGRFLAWRAIVDEDFIGCIGQSFASQADIDAFVARTVPEVAVGLMKAVINIVS